MVHRSPLRLVALLVVAVLLSIGFAPNTARVSASPPEPPPAPATSEPTSSVEPTDTTPSTTEPTDSTPPTSQAPASIDTSSPAQSEPEIEPAIEPAALPVVAAGEAPALMVTEIAPDNTSFDHFEFFEVTNTTATTIDLAAVNLSYIYDDSVDTTRDVPLATPAGTTVEPGESLVLWLTYSTSTVDAPNKTEQEFRDHWSAAGSTTESYRIVRVTGQNGMANGGDRGIRIVDAAAGNVLTWSYYSAGSVAADRTAQFRIADDPSGTTLLAGPAVANPGAVADETFILPPPPPADGPLADLFVSEIAPDNVGFDDYEFFEITNRGTTAVSLDNAQLAYIYDNSTDTTRDVPLSAPAGTSIAAGESLVLWLTYTTDTVTAPDRTEQEFRDHWSAAGAAAADYRIVRVTGQSGMANGGNRGVRISDAASGASITWSYYPSGSVDRDLPAHFGVAETESATVLRSGPDTPTPGEVDVDALKPPGPDPFDPQPDPNLVTAPLQITELVPDSTNVNGADGYEFIEIYNATTAPIDFADYTIDYLYPAADLTINNVANWPSDPSSFVIEPAATAVFWIKNGSNGDLTAADFNAHYGTALDAGRELVEIDVSGMSNSGIRGMEVLTNTGFALNRAFYNVDGADDTTADVGIQYRTDPAQPELQVIGDHLPATPGSVDPSQVPAGLMITQDDTTAPMIADETPSTIDPTADFAVDAIITDDVQVRTVTITIGNNVDNDAITYNIRHLDGDRYRYQIPAVDLTGLDWVEYTVRASDGTQQSEIGPVRVAVDGADQAPVRLNVDEGDLVSGETWVSAAGDEYPPTVELRIDDQRVEPLEPTLETSPMFAFEATSTDAYFRNGVLIGDEVLAVFDEGFYANEVTVPVAVPLEHVALGQALTLTVAAGTKAAPEIDENENNDDFEIRNVRLVLPDGRTLRPAGGVDPADWIRMGDSTGKYDLYDATFALPDDAFTALGAVWDTTAVDDGPHLIEATNGADHAAATVIVDNTAPTVDATINGASIDDGALYQGALELDVVATDAGAGVASTTVLFDGDEIEMPFATSSLTLPAGTHELSVTSIDQLGNQRERSFTFHTPVEAPAVTRVGPADGGTLSGDVELQARVDDPSGDLTTVEFRTGQNFSAGDASLDIATGAVNDADTADRSSATPVSADDRAAMAVDDGVTAITSSDDALPYQIVRIPVDGMTADDEQVRITWKGAADDDARISLSVLEPAGGWRRIDETVADGAEVTLSGIVPAAEVAADGTVTALIQHSVGYAGASLSDRSTTIEPANAGDVPRDQYDFTIGWESDTQYYNETYPDIQLDINEYFLDRRDDINLQYVIHTGDIVNIATEQNQWENADPAYRLFDDAGLPYGVLAGNHDVSQALADYTQYSQWFGADRYDQNPWWGGDYLDNRGHYDLISVDGIDFLMLYMGWAPGDAEIEWMNDVLAQYPERTALLLQHEYMLTTGGLGPIPQRIYDEVVAPNPNVRMVMSGHYHDAYTRIDSFDDDGDGVAERDVYQMLFDYQGLPEGGQGFLRLLHFDHERQQIMVRTYSPYLDQYNSDDPRLDLEHQQFEIPYEAVGVAPRIKVIETDLITADVLGGESATIGTVADVATGSTVSATWNGLADGSYSWYAIATDPYGAVGISSVGTFTVVNDGGGGSDDDCSGNSGGRGRGNNCSGDDDCPGNSGGRGRGNNCGPKGGGPRPRAAR